MDTSPIQVLHVDDDPSQLKLTGEFLKREDDQFVIETATSADEGLEILADRPPDCIISDYDMPRQNGIEFLTKARKEHSELPFILFTGKGSEEVASDAISNGATDYLQKGRGTDQYELLANRVKNAVEQYRSTRRAANLERIRQLSADINQCLVRATSPNEIETQVCQVISSSKPYVTACIADVDRDTMEIEPRTWAGDTAGYFEELDMAVDEESPGRYTPGGRAFHDREVAVSQNIEEDEQYARWQEPALRRGFRSLAVVPIEHGGALYGLLATFASRSDAFDQTERELLVELADDIGHALHSQHIQTELERSRDFLREAERLGDIGAWEFDATGRLTLTDGTRRIFEVPDDYTPTLDQAIEFFHPGDEPSIERTVEAALDNRESFDLQARLITAEDNERWIHLRGKPLDDSETVRGYIQDITNRKQRQQELEKNERRYQSILEDPNVLAGILDTDGTLLEQNQTGMEYIDAGLEDIIGEPFWETPWWPEDLRPVIREKVEQAASGEYVTYEVDLTEPDGDAYYVTGVIRPVTDDDEQIASLVVSARDITERTKRERELESFQRAVEEAADGMAVLEDDEYVYVDQTHVDMYGFDAEDDLLGETWQKLYDDDEVARLEEVAFPVLESEGHWRGMVTGSRPDGSTFPAELSLTITGDDRLVCTVRDETERKEREQKLELVETLFEHAQECQFIIDVADGAFELRHANEYYKRIVGLSPGEPVTGQTPTESFGDTGGQESLNRYRDCVESRECVSYTDELSVPEEGTVYRTILTPVVTDDEVTHIVGTARDITDHKRREEKLKRRNERLEEFASVVSHDLRNPLRVADGRLELVQEECESDHIEDVMQALDRMETLIDDLLTLAREGEHVRETEWVDLADVVETCWKNVKTGNAVVNVNLSHAVKTDRSRLAQLLENLIRNAVEHTTDDVAITVGDLENGFYIEDDGSGIPEDERDNVFDVGYSTTEGGTGFGLSIAEQVAKAHGWDIRVTDSDDDGAQFEITGVDTAE